MFWKVCLSLEFPFGLLCAHMQAQVHIVPLPSQDVKIHCHLFSVHELIVFCEVVPKNSASKFLCGTVIMCEI